MNNKNTLWWLLGGSVLAYLIYNRQSVQNIAQAGEDTVTAALTGWESVQQGPYWVPIISSIEQVFSIPPGLLSRIAYQESHFRPDVIAGTTKSGVGALGMMQLMPQYFTSVQRPIPFTDADTVDQINEAAHLLQGLYNHYGDWGLAVAAYNDGQGNIDQYMAGNRALPDETATYVTDVLADVPVASQAFQA